MDVDNVFVVGSAGFAKDFDYRATLAEDLAYLRGLPGVVAATPSGSIPLSGGGSATTVTSVPNKTDGDATATFEMDEQSIAALGVTLAAGRPFDAQEILPPTQGSEFVPQVILTKALAKVLFPPDGDALGKTVYDNLNSPATVVGIIEQMHGTWVNWDALEHVTIFPRLPEWSECRSIWCARNPASAMR